MITFNKKTINNDIIILLTSIIFIIIYSSLSNNTRKQIAIILTTDLILVFTVIILTIISYFNLISGFVLCIMFIIMLLPYFMEHYTSNAKLNNSKDKKEGFTSSNNKKKKYKKVSIGGPEGDKEVEDIDLFKSISGKGERVEKFMKKVDNYKTHKKREEAYNNLVSSNNNVIKKKYKTHSDSYEENLLEETENIMKDNETEDFKGQETIKIRKFDPNNEFDNNLLMTKDICDDIKKRITYEYESIPYLKRYISSRLQEIIDLLDLSA
jgi:Ca2+/Na+ antiporter